MTMMVSIYSRFHGEKAPCQSQDLNQGPFDQLPSCSAGYLYPYGFLSLLLDSQNFGPSLVASALGDLVVVSAAHANARVCTQREGRRVQLHLQPQATSTRTYSLYLPDQMVCIFAKPRTYTTW